MTDDTASETVTAGDAGLPVVDSEGNQIGVVAAVEDDDVEVDPDPDVSDDARVALGWERTENVTYSLPRDDFDRLRGEDALEALPKTDLDRSASGGGNGSDEDASPDGVLRVDLGDLNRRG